MLMTRQTLVRNFKILFAAHHYAYISKDTDEIASVVNVSRRNIQSLIETPEFLDALSFWSCKENVGDFDFAERVWTEMIQNSEHLTLVEYPDKPFRHTLSNTEVFQLIESHLFCADNLSDDEIRQYLADERKFESEPVRYEGQALENRNYFWIYPNYDEGIYSRVFARVNVVGDLVIRFADETYLVCIRHGRLTLTRKSTADDVVNVYDKRLLVCL